MSSTAEYVEYRTRSGDTYDLLAIAAYNDEKMASHIIKANPLYMGTLVFEEGVTLRIPKVEKTKLPSTLPPWRR
ncbi:MAG: tail protein X [Bacillus sp. (in: Bacteria)]|nr:tail protein X [Bacillus sp. (in: firmicutes)]MCM1427130.1 tail protein X [Eubacterium sp.]